LAGQSLKEVMFEKINLIAFTLVSNMKLIVVISAFAIVIMIKHILRGRTLQQTPLSQLAA
jgi:hypothetical protein